MNRVAHKSALIMSRADIAMARAAGALAADVLRMIAPHV